MAKALWKIGQQSLKQLTYELAIPIWGLYPHEVHTYTQERIFMRMFIAAYLPIIVPNYKQPKCPPTGKPKHEIP